MLLRSVTGDVSFTSGAARIPAAYTRISPILFPPAAKIFPE
jgi:hypothetical protein